MAVNAKGVFLSMKEELEAMKKRGAGVIVNNSSISGVAGTAYQCAYAASKHAVIGLTKCAAREYAAAGIRVNAVCAGFIDTDMTSSVEEKNVNARVPMKRKGTPEEIADAVLWLCSDGAAYMTGHALVIDGGWTTTVP